jgi:hypothetical protein
MARYDIEVFADYFQFYLQDAGIQPSAPLDYTDDDVRRRVKVAPNVVVVQPVRNMTVPVVIEVLDRDPGVDIEAWDHVTECSLSLPTGHLQVDTVHCNPKLDLELTPGEYRVRCLFAELDRLSEDGLDGDDRYQVQLWPDAPAELRVVKQWTEGVG